MVISALHFTLRKRHESHEGPNLCLLLLLLLPVVTAESFTALVPEADAAGMLGDDIGDTDDTDEATDDKVDEEEWRSSGSWM